MAARSERTALESARPDVPVGESPNEPAVRLIPLGGLGEIGLNMMLVECGEDVVAVDCADLGSGIDVDER